MSVAPTSMFHRLRNRLILINVAITTIILLVAFTSIYLVAQEAAARRPIGAVSTTQNVGETSITINTHIQADRRAALNSLLGSLITVGIAVEFIVIILSHFWAEAAIQPVRNAYETQKTFIANASHEIKTPLAAISANLEAAGITGNRWIDNTEREVQKLTALNQELLTLTRIDGSSAAVSRPEPIIVEPFLQEVVDSFAARIKERRLNLRLEVSPAHAKISVAKLDLEQLLSILLDNAVKYGKRDLCVAYRDKRLVIENDGATIPPAALPHIFERFYQSDKNSSGVGLGLAIAQSLAKRNHWRLSAESDQTTRFSIDFS